MIRDLFIREIEKYGGDTALAERLLIHGHRPFTTWLVHKFCAGKDETPIRDKMEDFADLAGVSVNAVRHSYFRATTVTLVDAKRAESYAYLRQVLEGAYPYPALWSELMRYAFTSVRRLAIEILLEQCVGAAEIEVRLNVSHSLVYTIRKEYTARFLQQKGDYVDDNKSY